MENKLTIGLFGFGCVGQGLYDVLQKSVRFKADIKTICVKDRNKQRPLPPHLFTFDKHAILDDPEINLVVELIDDADEAFRIVKTALRRGKNVVSANKKMVAEHLPELIELQRIYNVSLLYEASCCGGIPIIRTLEEYYDNELLNEVSGIFNGSSNYILSKIFNEGQDYTAALKKAQELGFAETDPTLDVGGYDPKYKLSILTAHAYGIVIRPQDIFNYGIAQFNPTDLHILREAGLKVKLRPSARKLNDTTITAYVLPEIIPPGHKLYAVENEYNAVLVEAAFSDQQLFIGKGAGGHPTGSAVLSDISALAYAYKYEYKKTSSALQLRYSDQVTLPVYLRTADKRLAEKLRVRNARVYEYEEGWFVLGDVSLQDLKAQKQRLEESGSFVAILRPEYAAPLEEAIRSTVLSEVQN